MKSKAIGFLGERAVCRYLQQQGYRIVSRNFTVRGGEIDIIASCDDVLAFVEVKTRKVDSMVTGMEAVTPAKQRVLIRTAQQYLLRFPDSAQPRFDVAEVRVDENGELYLQYIKNAFDASGLGVIL